MNFQEVLVRKTRQNQKCDIKDFLCLNVSSFVGASDKRVIQSPFFITKGNGESVEREINCSHSIPSYDTILWYKQDKRDLIFLGYITATFPTVEVNLRGKVDFHGAGSRHASLTIKELSVNDSAVYFCAASQHSAAESLKVYTKTHNLISDSQT